jgi:hypothetical protein
LTNGLGTFWAIFSRTHLVTLLQNFFAHKISKVRNVVQHQSINNGRLAVDFSKFW